jgi:hypothetical protein
MTSRLSRHSEWSRKSKTNLKLARYNLKLARYNEGNIEPWPKGPGRPRKQNNRRGPITKDSTSLDRGGFRPDKKIVDGESGDGLPTRNGPWMRGRSITALD